MFRLRIGKYTELSEYSDTFRRSLHPVGEPARPTAKDGSFDWLVSLSNHSDRFHIEILKNELQINHVQPAAKFEADLGEA